MRLKFESAFLVLFAVYMIIASVANFSDAEYLAGAVNVGLAAISLFMAGKKLAKSGESQQGR